MLLEEEKLLTDILSSVISINDYIQSNRTFDYFYQHKVIRRAVERELEIIGEAVRNLQKINSRLTLQHTNQIIAVRNRIAHAYDGIDYITIWSIVINHLPNLKIEIESLFNK